MSTSRDAPITATTVSHTFPHETRRLTIDSSSAALARQKEDDYGLGVSRVQCDRRRRTMLREWTSIEGIDDRHSILLLRFPAQSVSFARSIRRRTTDPSRRQKL